LEKVLLPAIEPLAAMLKGAGWTCDIERTPQGFKVAAFRGDMVVYGSRERPSLSFEVGHIGRSVMERELRITTLRPHP
jgi:hypothetical protein